MSLARVHNFAISLDGFGTGEGQTQEAPFGHAGERLHEWMFATQWWNEMVGKPGGSSGIDDAFSQRFAPGIGAEIMGANKFGHPGWHEEPDWKGWWGPPFHTPTFILTHQPRPSIEMEGGTTFHFIDASPAEALEIAREAADGQDVRLGGGPTMISEFLAAGLVDHMHITTSLLSLATQDFAVLHENEPIAVTWYLLPDRLPVSCVHFGPEIIPQER